MADQGQSLVSAAEQYLGTAYSWGGESKGGVDCSGLVQAAAKAAGIAVPRTAFEQSNVGAPVTSAAEARPGDLIFFAGAHGTLAHPGHVGIYVGNGMMIDANHTGGSVGIRPMKGYGQVAAVRRIGSGGPPSTPPDNDPGFPSFEAAGGQPANPMASMANAMDGLVELLGGVNG